MLVFLPSLVHAAQDKTEINGLYFDLFDNYGTGTCRFTAHFGESGMQSTYTGNIVIPGTVPYNNKTYTVTTLGASVFERANVTSVYIPNTITAIENLSNVPSMKGIMCNIADPNTIKDSPQSFGKTISESNSNLYKLGSYTDNCVLVVPAGSKSSYTSNGWGTVFKGGIYEGIVIIADNKSMTYGDNIPQLTWSHFKVKSDPIYGSPAFSCTATRQSPVGTYDIVITSGNLQTSDITNFKNGTLTINKAPLTITAKSYTINQGDPLPSFECTYSGFKNSETNNVLTTQPSFRCSATSTSAPGTYDIIVSGGYAQNYSMTYVKGTLTILKSIKDLDNSDITIDPIGSVTYNGLTQTPAVIVKDGGTTLTSGTDYTVSYSNNTNAGTATVTITGMGNYTGTKTATFTIEKASLTVTAKNYTINQGDPMPTFECTFSGFVNSEDETVLTTQPTVSCSAISSSAPGEYDITASGASAQNYSISYVKGKLTINARSISNIIISPIAAVTYNGLAQIPSVTVTDGSTSLTNGTDYTVSYSDNTNAGTATVTITGMGNYTGTKTATFTIEKAPLTVMAKSYTINQGDPMPTFECTFSGFVNNEDETVLTTQPTFTCTASSSDITGDYDIVVNDASAENYLFNYINGVLTILQSDVLATGISLNESSLTLTAVGQTATLTATVTPDDVTDNSVTWLSSNTAVATVSGDGVVTAVANGTAIITATTADGTNYTAQCAITVSITDNISFVDDEVKALCVANWDTNGDGELSKAEAAAVTDLSEVFRGHTTITSFDELQYFTGLVSIGNNAFYDCQGMISVIIPNSVTSIGDNAFIYCHSLAGMIMPNSVTSIGSYAFCGCWKLTNVEISNSVTNISNSAFSGCSSLSSVIIPNSVTVISEHAFHGARNLTNVTIPNSVRTIGREAFFQCSGLISVDIPNSVRIIGASAFQECSGIQSLTISNSVTSIGESAFENCGGLMSISVDPDNPKYDSRDNCNALIETETNTLITGSSNTVIPNSVTSIGSVAFDGCYGLKSIVIPNSVTSIGNYAFLCCSGLTSLTIGNSVTHIGRMAFSGCSNLTSVVIPKSVASLGGEAFRDCSRLTSVTVEQETPYSITESTFTNRTNATLYVPAGCKVAYEYADFWNEFKEIVEIDAPSPTLATGISLDTTSLTLTAVGQTATLISTVTPDDVTDNSVTWSSSNTAVATVSSDGVVTAVANGTAVITATTVDGTNLSADCVVTVSISHINLPDDLAYVDLGLPSGTLWANMNVGAESVEGFGNHYAWGETETKETYTLDNYKFTSAMTKYNSSDGLTTLESCDDAATANWGDHWRTPTKAEWQELVNNCTRQWTTVNGIYGYRFKGSNGNSIFVPAWVNNEAGYYWTSTLGSDIRTAYNVDYDRGGIYIDAICFEYYRGDARNIRAVYEHLKCATPTITYAEGKLKFTSETEGVTFVSTVTVGENISSFEDEVPLTPVYRVSVYAKKEGYEDSEIATKDVDFRALRGDVNDDGEITISDAVGIVNIILENNDSATEE